MKDKAIYKLTIEDIQTVAKEGFGRKLTSKEISEIKDLIGDRIPWYDVILETIKYKLRLKELD